MRIFSRVAIQFDHPADQEPAVIVQSQSFTDVPHWVSESLMFKLATKTGDVTIVENKQDEEAAETRRRRGGSKNDKDATKDSQGGVNQDPENQQTGDGESGESHQEQVSPNVDGQ